MKTILVTGAGGYIGIPLCERLLESGYRVKGLDRYFFGWDKIGQLATNPNFDPIKTDLRAVDRTVVKEVDCILDLAGLSNDATAEIDPQLTTDINRDGAVRLAQIAKEVGVKRYIYSSSASVYGHGAKPMLTEKDVPDPITKYAESKVAVEKRIRPLNDDDFEVVILRNATVYGVAPRMRFDLAVNIMTMRAWKEHVIYVMGGGQQWRPFVHLQDVIQAMILALQAETEAVAGEVFNVGDESQNMQIKQLAQLVYSAIPGTVIHNIPDDPDRRTYSLSFDKIRRHLGYRPSRTVQGGISEIKQALEQHQIDPDDPTTHTLNWYKSLLEWENRIKSLSFEGSVLARTRPD